MSRRHAKFTQADVARIIRAAKQTGAANITIRPDGSFVVGIDLTPTPASASPDDPPVALAAPIVL
jgi:hypothetical protein